MSCVWRFQSWTWNGVFQYYRVKAQICWHRPKAMVIRLPEGYLHRIAWSGPVTQSIWVLTMLSRPQGHINILVGIVACRHWNRKRSVYLLYCKGRERFVACSFLHGQSDKQVQATAQAVNYISSKSKENTQSVRPRILSRGGVQLLLQRWWPRRDDLESWFGGKPSLVNCE